MTRPRGHTPRSRGRLLIAAMQSPVEDLHRQIPVLLGIGEQGAHMNRPIERLLRRRPVPLIPTDRLGDVKQSVDRQQLFRLGTK